MGEPTLQAQNKKTASPELLRDLKAKMPTRSFDPQSLSEILRRAKGGCMIHRYRSSKADHDPSSRNTNGGS